MNAPTQFDDPTTLRWWAAALKGERRPINSNEPMTGYYRARSKNKQTGEETLYAVAYWWHNGNCFCRTNSPGTIGAAPTLTGEKHERMMAAWPYVSKEPIEYDVYQSVLAGNPWPDQHVAPKAALAEASNGLPQDAERQGTPPPAAGAAPPPAERTTEVDTSPQAVLRREIEAARAGIANYVKREPDGKASSLIDSDAMAGAAQSLRAQLLAFSNKAKKAREDANRPHNDAIRANGQIWTPLEFLAKSTADDLRDGPIKAWEVHKRELASMAKAARSPEDVVHDAVAGGYHPKSNAPAPSAKIKGATGKAASVQEIKIAVIHDQDQVYGHFRSNEQIKAILQGLANAAVRAGIEVPGATTDNDVSIR